MPLALTALAGESIFGRLRLFAPSTRSGSAQLPIWSLPSLCCCQLRQWMLPKTFAKSSWLFRSPWMTRSWIALEYLGWSSGVQWNPREQWALWQSVNVTVQYVSRCRKGGGNIEGTWGGHFGIPGYPHLDDFPMFSHVPFRLVQSLAWPHAILANPVQLSSILLIYSFGPFAELQNPSWGRIKPVFFRQKFWNSNISLNISFRRFVPWFLHSFTIIDDFVFPWFPSHVWLPEGRKPWPRYRSASCWTIASVPWRRCLAFSTHNPWVGTCLNMFNTIIWKNRDLTWLT